MFVILASNPPRRAAAAPTLLTGIAGYWRFEGNLTDSSGNGKNFAGTGTYTTGKIGQALTGKYAQASVYTGGDWSASMWMYAGAGSAAPFLYISDALEINNLEVTFNNWAAGQEYLKILGPDGNSPDQVGFIVPEDTWAHVVLTSAAGVLKAYLNGSLVWTGSSASIVANLISIGTNGPGSAGPADEAGAWNLALTADQVAELYAAGAGFDPTA